MAFEKICTLDDVWEGDMYSSESETGVSVLIIGVDGGEIKAFQGICPHQEIELIGGELTGNVLTCRAHLWQFDVTTGKGINPDDCKISEYPTKLEGDDIYVDVEGVEPFTSHS